MTAVPFLVHLITRLKPPRLKPPRLLQIEAARPDERARRRTFLAEVCCGDGVDAGDECRGRLPVPAAHGVGRGWWAVVVDAVDPVLRGGRHAARAVAGQRRPGSRCRPD